MSRSGISDEALQKILATPRIRHVPKQAYEAEPLTWCKSEHPPVWVWVDWVDGPYTREPGWVHGYNSRIVIVTFQTDRGERSVTAWRSAVTHRKV